MNQNPIPSRVRGWILVAAISTGAATGTVTTIMAGLGSPTWAIAAVASATAGISTVAAALSRANLTLDSKDQS